ncbi:MAG: AmmeMemoRadiSam system protein B [Thermoguttaceae bacterium]|nr:AmmeMemoRadiSam system protein B [Thermoguttaceae bacterium]MDO4424243.1 AmmeMemoRadiSam system protein B [Planctomycetia bacterium]
MDRPAMRNLTLSPYISPEDMVKEDAAGKEPNKFLLEDPEGYAPPLVLPVPLAILISMMDGKRTLKEIMDEFTEQTHEPMSLSDLKEMVAYLDKLHYLDSPSFANFLKNEMNAYARERYRPAAMAGGAYPKDGKELRKMLARILEIPRKITQAEEPEKEFDSIFPESICGAVSTHTELEGGGASYGWTFSAIANHSAADKFILLGTSHNPMREKFAFSSKSFDTPLGVLPVDFEFQKRAIKRFAEKYEALENIESRESVDLLGDDFVHRDEHSLEFQAIFLKYLAETQKRDIRIVPILVNTFVPFLAARDVEYPDENEVIRLFLETLSELIQEDESAGKGCFFVMASADLAHVGPMYGTPAPVDGATQDGIREKDTEILESVQKTASRDFWQKILKNFNENKISGAAPIYCAIRLLEHLGRTGGGKLLSYEQAVDEETKSCVSFASVVFK